MLKIEKLEQERMKYEPTRVWRYLFAAFEEAGAPAASGVDDRDGELSKTMEPLAEDIRHDPLSVLEAGTFPAAGATDVDIVDVLGERRVFRGWCFILSIGRESATGKNNQMASIKNEHRKSILYLVQNDELSLTILASTQQ